MKKIVSLSFSLLLLASLMMHPNIALAGRPYPADPPKKYQIYEVIRRTNVIRGYTYVEQNTVAYTEPSTSSAIKGTVFPSDYIKIYSDSRDGKWLQVSWPVTGTSSWKTGYIPITAVFPTYGGAATLKTATAKSNTYIFRNGGWTYVGYIDVGDNVYTFSTQTKNGYVLVIYQLSGNDYKIAWARPNTY